MLKIIHRPLPALATGNSKATKRLSGADQAALEVPKKALEAFCKANGVDVAQRFKTAHEWPQHVAPVAITGKGTGGKAKAGVKEGDKRRTVVDSLGKEKAEGLLKKVTEWLGVLLSTVLTKKNPRATRDFGIQAASLQRFAGM